MLSDLENFYLQKAEPIKSCLLTLREIILNHDSSITQTWKYRMPFFCYKGKMCCYLWEHKKFKQPYLGIVNGNLINDPDLLIEKRSRMKILLINPLEDLPIKKINRILAEAVYIYNKQF